MAIVTDRIERLLSVIVEAADGNYAHRVPLTDVDDELLELEVGVNFLIDELALKHERNEAQKQALVEQAKRITAQSQALVSALSTPIIVLSPGVLALPLIGHFDLDRATNVTETVLERVASEHATHVILDLTGIGEVAVDTINALLSMVRALGLLGVRCLLTGINPASARTIVEFGADLSQLRTFARVSDALAEVMSEKGLWT